MLLHPVHAAFGLHWTSLDHAASDARAAATERQRSVCTIVAAGMDHDRSPANLLDSEMWGCDSLVRIAVTIDEQHRQVAEMATGVERPQMLFGLGRIVVAARREAGSGFALIDPWSAITCITTTRTRRAVSASRRRCGTTGRRCTTRS